MARPQQAFPNDRVVADVVEAPSGEKTADIIMLVCSCKVFKHSPEATDQIFAVLSSEPINTKAPSNEKTADNILPARPCKVFVPSRSCNAGSSRCRPWSP
jgi:hypothetical protein